MKDQDTVYHLLMYLLILLGVSKILDNGHNVLYISSTAYLSGKGYVLGVTAVRFPVKSDRSLKNSVC